MISHKHKTIFIHIPKAAGTSIESFFLDDLGLDFEDKHPLILGKSTNMHMPPRVLSHLTATQMVSQHYISQQLFDSYFKFSITRHPVERLFSTYKYLGYESVISFDTFIIKMLPVLLKNEKNHFFLKPQTEFLFDNALSKNLMDFTGKIENLKKDFLKITTSINIANPKLKHKNKAKEKSSFLRGIKKVIENPELIKHLNFVRNKEKNISRQAIKVIKEIYRDDFKNFNYKLK